MPDLSPPEKTSSSKFPLSSLIIYVLLVLVIGAILWIALTEKGTLLLDNFQKVGVRAFFQTDNPDREREASNQLKDQGYIVAPSPPVIPVTTVNFCEKPATPEALEQLAYCTNLKALLLNGTGVHDDQLQCLSNLSQLTSLVLNSNPITDAGLKHLVQYDALTLAALLSIAALVLLALGLSMKKYGWKTWVAMAALFAGLVLYVVCWTPSFLMSGPKSVSDLHLAGTDVGDAGLKSLAKLSKLSILNLSKSKVTDEGMETLQSLPELANLLLDETAVTDAGLKAIANFPALKRLSLYQSKVTPDGVKTLKNAMPSLTVDYQPPK
jgi:hypothetical protein